MTLTIRTVALLWIVLVATPMVIAEQAARIDGCEYVPEPIPGIGLVSWIWCMWVPANVRQCTWGCNQAWN